MALVWEQLCCDGVGAFCTELVRGCCMAKKNKQILSSLNGYLKFGELTALMGPSGSGKSTLLNCLTQGENYKGTRGRIAVESKMKARSVLITQNEANHLLFNLTVFESLYYASEMKNPYKTTRSEHTEIVNQLLADLDLSKVSNVTVRRCSGGQKKRIAIGLELTAIMKPNFLLLDEPTSGLDSHSGFNVIYRLRHLAEQLDIAVVTVIHQPSFEIFSQFHNVYILSKVGRCVFSGSPRTLQDHLNNYGYRNANSNPADIIISIASSVSKDDDEIVNIDVEEGHDSSSGAVKGSDEMKNDCEQMMKRVSENWSKNIYANSGVDIQQVGLCSSDVEFKLYSLWVLLKRTFITSLFRQKRLVFIRLALHLVVAVLLTSLYSREIGIADACFMDGPMNCGTVKEELRKESVPGENVKFQFFSLLFLMFAALMPTVLTFPADIKLFINEHRNGWYTTSFYYIAKTLMEIPVQLIFSFCYVYFLYAYTNQEGMNEWYGGIFGFMSRRYGYFLFVTVLSCFIAQGLGFLIGIICVNSFSMAIILSSSVLLFQFLFSGFFVKVNEMDPITEKVTYLSFIRFSFESLLIILYGDNRCQPQLDSVILFEFDLKDADLFKNVMWIVGHLVVSRFVAFFLLLKLANPRIFSFSRFSLNCSCLSDRLLPVSQSARRNLGWGFFLALKIFAVIFMLQILVGMSIIIVREIWKQ